MDIMIKTILRQIITHCRGTGDIIKKLSSCGLEEKGGFKMVAFKYIMLSNIIKVSERK